LVNGGAINLPEMCIILADSSIGVPYQVTSRKELFQEERKEEKKGAGVNMRDNDYRPINQTYINQTALIKPVDLPH
jgi:hypothetical protein